ncbi:hypothetical protein B0H63DRAFT_541513 [Podospora didyma]|uniref:BTB domain-containing protein n=1 Tax=Podospora didyma TaxID=330526 RepID=A0AAE0NT83_9PEZI|nr:hypothetical protein B0H63DRAFT_541513 [Podospora didyma]
MAERGTSRPARGQQSHSTAHSASYSASQHLPPISPGETEGTDRWLTDRIVTVIVGPEEKRWAVHEKLLSSKSKFFDHVFNGVPGETPAHDELKLEGDDPKLFALLIRWLYGTAFATSGGSRVFRFALPDGKDITVRDYLGLYVLGDKIGIVGVKNAAIDVLYQYYGQVPEDVIRVPSLFDVKYVFDNTDGNAQIRRLLIAHALFFLFSKKRANRDPLPEEWQTVLSENGEIAWSMIKMLSDWRWTIGRNVPEMNIKPKQEFHEPVPLSEVGLGGARGNVVKAEPKD